MAHRFVFLLACLLLAPSLIFAQDGAALFRTHCATCHESGGQTRAPSRDALRQLTPERIIYALESIASPMANVGLARTHEERRAIATYLSAKPFGTEKGLDLEQAGCKQNPGFSGPTSDANWNGWSVDRSNNRFQTAASAGLDANRVAQLKLKWAFAFPGDIEAYSQPTVVADRIFVGSEGRRVYSLDRATGCVYWVFTADAGVRAAISVGQYSATAYAAYVADLAANVYALDAATGKLLWKINVDKHRAARITGAPALKAGRLFVPVASLEEGSGAVPSYECCTFRGSVVALETATGKQIWKTYTIPEPAKVVGKNSKGVRQFGPSGVGVWSSPTVDTDHKVVYVATGDNYSQPATKTSDAIMALDLETGRMLWVRQLTDKDAWNVACISPDQTNCPQGAGPDFDFASSPILVDLPGGKRALVAGQKSGVVHAVDPDREGEVLWQVRAGKGGVVGGIEWGPAADEKNMYVAVSDMNFNAQGLASPTGGGGLLALQLSDGKQLWRAEPPPCPADRRGCSPAQSAAVTVIPGVVFSGSMDGHLRAFSATDGGVIWDFDTAREFTTVNAVPGHGGSINGPGPTVAGGMLFVESGYGFLGQMPGNVLLAFEP